MRCFSSLRQAQESPAARLLRRKNAPLSVSSSLSPPSTPVEFREPKPVVLGPPSAEIPWISSLSKLFQNMRNSMALASHYGHDSKRVTDREGIRGVLRAIHDIKVIIPATLYLSIPFKSITLPFLFKTAPNLFPSSHFTADIMRIKMNAVKAKRDKLSVALVENVAHLVGKRCGKETDGSVEAVFRRILANTSSITYNELASLVPLFKTTALATSPHALSSYLNFTLPYYKPYERLLIWTDWILKDDAILRREGAIQELNWFELCEALEERGFRINVDAMETNELKELLKSHLKFSKAVLEAVGRERGHIVDTSGNDRVGMVAAMDLGMCGEELGAVAGLFCFARGLDVVK